MARQSAGLLLYRIGDSGPEVFLVHPGGPFYRNKDDGVWSVPKGEHEPQDDPVAVALREFEEEVGVAPPVRRAELHALGSVQQRGGKVVTVWTGAGDVDPATVESNTFRLEWPPKSGRIQEFPEVDRAGWFTLPAAKQKLLPAQVEFVDRLRALLGAGVEEDSTPPSRSA